MSNSSVLPSLPQPKGQQLFCVAAAVVCALVGAFVLAQWQFEPGLDLASASGMPVMRFTTAICFVLSGATLLLCLANQANQARMVPTSVVINVLAFALAAIAGLALAWDVVYWDEDIAALLHLPPRAAGNQGAGTMSGAAALVFLLVGIALVLTARARHRVWLGQSLAAGAFLIALLSLLAELFGADIGKVVPFSSMAEHTAATFLLLCAGVLMLRGGQGWVREFFEPGPTARAGRRYMAGSMLALPLVAYFGIVGERDLGWYDSYFGAAILTVAGIAVLAILNWMAVRAGNAADRKIGNMLRVNQTLIGINTLIVQVREKPELFREACRIAGTDGRFPWVWIATLDAPQGRVSLQASQGGSDALRAGVDGLLDGDSRGDASHSLVQRVVRSQQPVVVHDLRHFEAATQGEVECVRALRAARLRSMVVLPLVSADTVAGVFALHAEHAGFFDRDEMRLLNELAGNIGFAINHIDKESTLHHLAHHDPLTSLPNRALFLERLGREMVVAARDGRQVALALCDLQRFRLVNESFGRAVGDALLCAFAARLRDAPALSGNLSRVHADTFACFIAGDGVDALGLQVEKLFSGALGREFQVGEQAVTVERTVAVAVFPGDGRDGETLLSNAETALRKAKAARVPLMFYESAMNARVAETLQLEYRLRQALERDQLELHYQPKVDLADGSVQGVEALMRWRDAERGWVPPALFIPLMEEIGLIRQAGAWALRQAVRDMEHLRASGRLVPRCAVNVSFLQLRDKDFVGTVVDAIAGFGDHAPLLDIEITETLLMQDVAQASAVLQTLRDLGVAVAVDDFGTGYSSLAYLARLPIHALKIDRAFITEMEQNQHGVAIVGSIISLAHSLHLVVIAEGVETEAQAAILRRLGCDLMQGYLVSKPVPIDALAALLPAAASATR